MTPTDNPDDRLSTLLSDAVADVEPSERLTEIRDRTRVVPLSSRRPWLFGVGGAVVATAAVITAVAIAGGVPGADRADSDPATSPSTPPTVAPSTHSQPSTDLSREKAYAVYYVGDGPKRPVLFREFHPVAVEHPGLTPAVGVLSDEPLDPDYRTYWPAGSFVGARDDGHVIDVVLANDSLHDRPAGMSATEARAAVQQVVYTMQAAVQQRLPVQFMLGQNPIDQVLGVPTSEPLANDFSALSLMSITSPADGAVVSRGKLVVSGVNNGFEGTAVVWLERDGKKYLTDATIGGWGGEKLYPWSVTLDLSTLAPGEYTVVASDPDPSGRGRAETDTRRIELK